MLVLALLSSPTDWVPCLFFVLVGRQGNRQLGFSSTSLSIFLGTSQLFPYSHSYFLLSLSLLPYTQLHLSIPPLAAGGHWSQGTGRYVHEKCFTIAFHLKNTHGK